MNSKLKKCLETAVDIGLPLAVGAATVYAFEKAGVSKMWQDYELAKIPLVKEYFGEFFGKAQVAVAYIQRGAVDFAGFITTSMLTKFFINEAKGK